MRTPLYSTPYDISSFSPPGVDVVSHMVIARFHGGASLMTYVWFYQMVRNHGPWDFKQGRAQYANFGNFHFGAVGAAAASLMVCYFGVQVLRRSLLEQAIR
ncbi:hypothetical protein [Enterobacter cloacae]|uniref:hypothetical protein n=1 Tax=Enterobacter cloacae TaxID=550 RepID=UPI0032AFF3CF